MRNFGGALYSTGQPRVNFWIEKKGIEYVIDIYRRIIRELSGDAFEFYPVRWFIS